MARLQAQVRELREELSRHSCCLNSSTSGGPSSTTSIAMSPPTSTTPTSLAAYPNPTSTANVLHVSQEHNHATSRGSYPIPTVSEAHYQSSNIHQVNFENANRNRSCCILVLGRFMKLHQSVTVENLSTSFISPIFQMSSLEEWPSQGEPGPWSHEMLG